VRLRVGPGAAGATLEVADTGIGIAADDLRHVFQRFWRGDRSRSRATGGAGIGLAIVRELVRAHDGRVEVDSTPGVGSTFRVLLPPLAVHENGRPPSRALHADARR
jgi:signal transduction histidine kinase